MDAEDVSDVMNALSQEGDISTSILEMAPWFYGGIREEDPEQAIRAALVMQEAIPRFSEERVTSLKMRIGLNTRLWRTTAPDRRANRSRIYSALPARRWATDRTPAA